ncbi:MAG TPA: tRNA lysidine(34) synthetase TilS [Flavipsychrobacter sp.]|nr:tRNA lysidine(34) synthetase TilS [Flavipsychrobacter sp.]
MSSKLPEQFQENWQKKRFITDKQTVLLAVSGGIDSMVMASLFLKSDIKFAIAHCNFQLRDKDADMDEQLVREWTIANKIPFHTIRFDTKKKSEEWNKGTQETARILRYEWLDNVRMENGYAKIATAHHANDNMETLLMNLFKGTGIAGLHAIPEQNGNIIRPLLFASRESLAEYAIANHIEFREDSSNATDVYLRNAVRHHIIPVVKEWFPDAISRVNESIQRFSQAELLYKKAIEEERKKLLEQRGQDYYIPILKLQGRQPLETLCYELFHPFGFNSSQVPHIIGLFAAESGHFIASSTHRIIRNRDFLIVTTIPGDSTDFITVQGAPGVIDIGKYHFHFSIEKKPEKIPTESNVAYIDMKRVEFPIILRKWHTGDYFYPFGMDMKKKKLSRFFIDQKLGLHEKEHIWILEIQKRIAWVAGMRLDERFKVKDTTEQVLRIEQKKV